MQIFVEIYFLNGVILPAVHMKDKLKMGNCLIAEII